MNLAQSTLKRLPIVGFPAPLPEVWASDLRILLLWEATATFNDLSVVERKLRGFNDRLYDCTDGQWRVGRFLINDYHSQLRTLSKGAGHLHRTDQHAEHGSAKGRPDDPEPWHVNELSGISTYLMEFLHSWTGLKDEYEEWEDGPRTNCPKDQTARDVSNACVMDTSYGVPTEFCRPENHNPDAEQGNVRGMDCYSWLAKVMTSAGKPGFHVPLVQIPGPRAAPALRFVYLVVQRVKQIDDPDPAVLQGAGDYFAKVRMGGAWLAPSWVESDSTDSSPNWFFGLGFSSSKHLRVPIRVEIWDSDKFSGADFMDVSPVGDKRGLDITLDTATGQITGDVGGTAGTPITVRGASAENRMEMTFVVTSR